MGAPPRLSGRAGAHRFVWNLRMPRPRVDAYNVSIAAVDGDAARLVPEGMLVAPGRYTVELAVDGRRQRSALDVVADPRVPVVGAALTQALALAADVGSALGRESLANGQVQAVHAQLDALSAKASGKPAAAQALGAFAARLAPLLEGEGEQAPMNLSVLGGELTALAADLEGSDAAPTAPQRALYATDAQRLEQALQLWTALRQEALPSLDATLAAAGLPEIRVPVRGDLRPVDAGASREMP